MPEENLEIVRLIYEAVNRDDWDAASRDLHPDFEMTLQRGPNAGTHRGPAEARRVLRDQRAAFESWIVEPEDVFELGEHVVVALTKSRLRPRGTDAEFELRNGHLWTIRDGVVLSLRAFPNPDDALEVAGQRD